MTSASLQSGVWLYFFSEILSNSKYTTNILPFPSNAFLCFSQIKDTMTPWLLPSECFAAKLPLLAVKTNRSAG